MVGNVVQNVVPKIQLKKKPTYIKLAGEYDFFSLFRKIERKYDNCFLFESLGEESSVSRYHVMGFDPTEIISASDKNTLTIFNTQEKSSHSYRVENPYYALRDMFPTEIVGRKYAGGLVGYLGYDVVNFFEPSLDVKKNSHFETFKFGLYLDGFVYDQISGEVYYFYYKNNRIDTLRDLLNDSVADFAETQCEFLGDTMSREDHATAVMQVKEHICNGLIFQCEVGFKSLFKISGDTTRIYSALRQVNPSPHMYYMKFGEQKIIGASPELLFRLRDGEMETFPLAGTAKRGKDHLEDMRLARALLNDPKEIAEHNMLVDLHRNDIGRVAEFNTVKVRNLMDIKRFSHVQHISSEITGILKRGEDMFSALAANFPAGTLSGAPKVEAMRIIDSIEPDGRGPYGGAIGQFNFNGDCAFAIPIRSVFINGEYAYAQTCGGNVYDSVPENEYEEIQRKLSAMTVVLKMVERKEV